MAEQQTNTTAQPAAKPDPKAPPKPAAPPAGAKPPETPPAKPTPEQRDRTEVTQTLLRAQKEREELKATRERAAALEKELEGLRGLDARERQRLAELAKSDLRGAFRELGLDLPGVTKSLLGQGKADPRDEVIAKLQKELEGVKGFVEETKKEREDRQKREAEAAEKAQADQVYDQMHGGMAYVVEQWSKTEPATDEERSKAAGDELLLSELRRNPGGWRAELVAYAKKNPNATGEQVRAHYGALLLRQQQERAKLRFVGALLGGSTTDAPTSQTGGNASVETVPRTRTRKPSGGAEDREDRSATKPAKHGLAQDEIDAARRPRRLGR